MGSAKIFYLDGSEKLLDHRPTLKEAQDIVGGYIEFVKIGHNQTLVVDDEGKLKNKDVNQIITKLYGNTIYKGYIVGDVIVLTGWRTVTQGAEKLLGGE